MSQSHFNLLPCPFCGSPAELDVMEDHHGEYFNLGCLDNGCPARWIYYTTASEDISVEEAVAKWNGRV